MTETTAVSARPSTRRRPSHATAALLGAAAFVVVSVLWGAWLGARGVDLHLSGGQPLTGPFDPRLPIAALLPVSYGIACWVVLQRLAWACSWRSLVAVSGLLAAGWAVALALTDGMSALGRPLESHYEYLFDVGRVTSVGALLDGFVSHVPANAAGFAWTTHVAGHPPGALLAFAGLDRLGLSGSGWAAASCIAMGASAVPAVLVTVRLLAGDGIARDAVPFVALSPLALWFATSGDALFAGVAAWAVAAVACASSTSGHRLVLAAAAGGALFGLALLMSYGLVLLGLLLVAVVVVMRKPVVLAVAGASVSVVFGWCASQGYWWWEGLSATADRVRDGPAWQDRPTSYFVVANLAALALAVGPAVVAGLATLARDRSALGRAIVLPAGALAAVAVAIVSGLSKGEAERIYLPFALWLLPAAAILPASQRRWWLAAQVATAVVVQLGWTLRW